MDVWIAPVKLGKFKRRCTEWVEMPGDWHADGGRGGSGACPGSKRTASDGLDDGRLHNCARRGGLASLERTDRRLSIGHCGAP